VYKGRVDKAEVVLISLCIGKRLWKGEVALMKGSELGDKRIFALNLRDNESRDIVNEYRKSALEIKESCENKEYD